MPPFLSRLPLAFLLLSVFVASCSDPECGENEQKIGKTCIFTGHAGAGDGGVVARDAAASGVDAAVGPNLPEGGLPAADPRVDDASRPPGESSDASVSGLDASRPAPPCYLDIDGDGAGSPKAPVECALYPTDGGGPLHAVHNADDCDDGDPKRAPSLTDVCGDLLDNDCNGAVDDKSNNACGGPCQTGLEHQPGQPCDNGLLGGCLRTGVFTCQGIDGTVCNAGAASPSTETCDSLDNDCDGTIDNGFFNECGGACTAVLTHKPGQTCTNGQLGACTMSGTYVCEGDSSTCNAPKMKPGNECNRADGIDNDCDGAVDDNLTTANETFNGCFLHGPVAPTPL